MLDAATKFLAARLIKRETTQDFVQAVERGWIRMFGPPSSLHVDSHRAWGSEAFTDYTTDHDIQLVMSPGEAHNRLAQLERRHHVLRRAVEIYMADKQQDTMACLKEALIYVIPQINATLSVGGFSPTQWVLGYQPHLPGSLLDNHTNIAHLSPGESFQQTLQSRSQAAASVLRADSDLRLRRALLRQHRGEPPALHVGRVGPRVRWKGPATVVLIEADASGKPNVYWLVHGTALLRAAPEHVRPDVESDTLALDAPSLHSLVQGVQNRGTTTSRTCCEHIANVLGLPRTPTTRCLSRTMPYRRPRLTWFCRCLGRLLQPLRPRARLMSLRLWRHLRSALIMSLSRHHHARLPRRSSPPD